MDEQSKLPTDEFSRTLRQLQANPAAIKRTGSIDLADFYGNLVTWHITTIRADGRDTVFVQTNTSDGGDRYVLPPEITNLVARQRDAAVTVNRKRGAAKAAATRKTAGAGPGLTQVKR